MHYIDGGIECTSADRRLLYAAYYGIYAQGYIKFFPPSCLELSRLLLADSVLELGYTIIPSIDTHGYVGVGK